MLELNQDNMESEGEWWRQTKKYKGAIDEMQTTAHGMENKIGGKANGAAVKNKFKLIEKFGESLRVLWPITPTINHSFYR